MKRTASALASALLLGGALASPAFAQEVIYQYEEPLFHNGDADNDGIPNAQDTFDDRFDEAGNPVRFEVGESLPPESYGNATAVDASLHGLRKPAAGEEWNRLGNNYYLVSINDGRVLDAVYNKRD